MPVLTVKRVAADPGGHPCSSPKVRISAPSMVRLRSAALLSRERRSERLLGSCKRRPRASGGMRSSAGEDPRHRNATRAIVPAPLTGRSQRAESDHAAIVAAAIASMPASPRSWPLLRRRRSDPPSSRTSATATWHAPWPDSRQRRWRFELVRKESRRRIRGGWCSTGRLVVRTVGSGLGGRVPFGR